MERRFISVASAPVRIQTRDGAAPQIVGYGAVFYDGSPATEYKLWDDVVERVMPTAFDRAVKEDDVRGLFNHDPNNLLGRTAASTMRLAVDAKGLRYEITPPATQLAKDVAESISRGDLSGSSFSFIPDKVVWIEERKDDRLTFVREIHSVQLFDTGPVTFPAYEATSVGSRSVEGFAGIKTELEKFKAARSAPPSVHASACQARARAVEIDC